MLGRWTKIIQDALRSAFVISVRHPQIARKRVYQQRELGTISVPDAADFTASLKPNLCETIDAVRRVHRRKLIALFHGRSMSQKSSKNRTTQFVLIERRCRNAIETQ